MDQDPTSMIEECGPLVLFATEFPQTVSPLSSISACWPQFDNIFFAFAHLRDDAMPRCAYYHQFPDIWENFVLDAHSNIDDYITHYIAPLIATLSFTPKLILTHAIREFLISCTKDLTDTLQRKDVDSIREPHAFANKCNTMGCVCMLLQNSTVDISTTTKEDLAPMWRTRNNLLASRSKKRARDEILDNETQ